MRRFTRAALTTICTTTIPSLYAFSTYSSTRSSGSVVSQCSFIRRRIRFGETTTTTTTTTRYLSSVVTEVDAPLAEESTRKVISEGDLISYSSEDGKQFGLAVVKLRDDAISGNVVDVADRVITADDGVQKEVVKKQKSSKKGQQGDDFTGRTVEFTTSSSSSLIKTIGVVVAQRPPIAFVLTTSPLPTTSDDKKTTISVLSERLTVPTSSSLFGKNINAFGDVIDSPPLSDNNTPPPPSSSSIDTSSHHAIFSPIPLVSEITLINTPLLTGITMIDALSPIGKGQNMLLVGEPSTGKRSLVRDVLRTQIEAGTKCFYARTSPSIDDGHLDSVVREDIIYVTATDDNNPAESVTVAATAIAHAEYLARFEGADTLVVIDALDGHKSLWDSTTRTLVELYGKDAVVADDASGGASSEMRAFFSGLIQRSAKFKLGGGSVTLLLVVDLPEKVGDEEEEEGVVYSMDDFAGASEAVKARLTILEKKGVPLTAATLNKIKIPVPSKSQMVRNDEYKLAMQHVDDLISMSDGQIWLDKTILEEQGRCPPLDPTRTITRVGVGHDTNSRADAPALRGLMGSLRFELAQGGCLDGAMDEEKQRVKSLGIWKALEQKWGHGRGCGDSVVSLLAARMGVFDGNGKGDVSDLMEYVRGCCGEVLDRVDRTLELSEDEKSVLEGAIREYFDTPSVPK